MEREKQVENDYRDFINLLNKYDVEYLIIGAYSVIYYTKVPRETKDIDFWIRRTRENASKCSAAIKEFCGADVKPEELLGDKEIFFIGKEPNRIDIFNEQKGLSFEEAFSRKKVGSFKGVKAFFISKDDLIKLKDYFYRTPDLKDLKRLKGQSKKHK